MQALYPLPSPKLRTSALVVLSFLLWWEAGYRNRKSSIVFSVAASKGLHARLVDEAEWMKSRKRKRGVGG